MDRAIFFLRSSQIRERVCQAIRSAPDGYRVEIKEQKRTVDQNSKMWPMLQDVASQVTHNGRKYTPQQWKCIFLNALGHEIRFLPTLAGDGFFPYGHRSSELSKTEFSDLIAMIDAFGAEHGVEWTEKPVREDNAA